MKGSGIHWTIVNATANLVPACCISRQFENYREYRFSGF